MAYNNFPIGYQPVQYYPQTQQTQQTQNGIIWVQGEAGAKSYLVAPNASVTLWDTESPTIYVKSADAVGMPSMKILDYKMRESAPAPSKTEYATRDEMMSISEKLSALQDKVNAIIGKEEKE